MTFLWPHLLWLFALVPLLVAAYVVLLRRQKRNALRYASLKLVREAAAGGRLRRHLPPLLFLVALAAMLVAMARPAAVVRLPTEHETVILSIDVSGSMKAKDVEPDRIGAAREAARAFVAEQPRSARIGVVEFSGAAALVQSPTRSREEINAALDRLQPQLATATGSGVLVALKAIFPEIKLDPYTGKAQAPPAQPAAPGSYPSAAIVLLSDGETNAGPDPLQAARTAAQFGVRVFTVGFGTTGGEVIHGEGWSMRVSVDERTLRGIAEITGGEYFHARTAPDLKKVYRTLNARLALERKETEITALFAAAAALAATLAGGLSLAWFNRVL